MPYEILSKMHGQLRLQHLSANHRYQTHESSMSQRPINTLSLLDLLYSVLAYVQQKRMRHTLTHSYYSFHLALNDYNLVQEMNVYETSLYTSNVLDALKHLAIESNHILYG